MWYDTDEDPANFAGLGAKRVVRRPVKRPVKVRSVGEESPFDEPAPPTPAPRPTKPKCPTAGEAAAKGLPAFQVGFGFDCSNIKYSRWVGSDVPGAEPDTYFCCRPDYEITGYDPATYCVTSRKRAKVKPEPAPKPPKEPKTPKAPKGVCPPGAMQNQETGDCMKVKPVKVEKGICAQTAEDLKTFGVALKALSDLVKVYARANGSVFVGDYYKDRDRANDLKSQLLNKFTTIGLSMNEGFFKRFLYNLALVLGLVEMWPGPGGKPSELGTKLKELGGIVMKILNSEPPFPTGEELTPEGYATIMRAWYLLLSCVRVMQDVNARALASMVGCKQEFAGLPKFDLPVLPATAYDATLTQAMAVSAAVSVSPSKPAAPSAEGARPIRDTLPPPAGELPMDGLRGLRGTSPFPWILGTVVLWAIALTRHDE